MTPSCDQCRYYDLVPREEWEGKGNPFGECKRYPPFRITEYCTASPEVEYSNWCGEFQPQEGI